MNLTIAVASLKFLAISMLPNSLSPYYRHIFSLLRCNLYGMPFFSEFLHKFEHVEVNEVNEVEFTVVMNHEEIADLMVEKSCKHYLLKCCLQVIFQLT